MEDLAGDQLGDSNFLLVAGVLGERGIEWPRLYSSTAWDCTGAMEGGMSPITEQRSSMEWLVAEVSTPGTLYRAGILSSLAGSCWLGSGLLRFFMAV